METVSVVMPVRNGARYIAEAVRSALDQGASVGEVIVVDDGSTDDTAAIVRTFRDARVRLMGTDTVRGQGVAAARNTGLAQARGAWLYFLDADDRLRAGAIARLVAAAGGEPDAVAVYGDYARMDASGRLLGQRKLLRYRQKPSGDILPQLLGGNFIATGTILVRTDTMRKVGGFPPGIRYAEDWYAWCRLAASGPIVYAPGVQVFDYRMHEASATMKTQLGLEAFQPALEAMFADPLLLRNFDPAMRSHLRRKAETFLRTYVACQMLRSGRLGETLAMVFETIRRHPRQTPHILSRTTAAALGF